MLSKHVRPEDVDAGKREIAPMFGSRVMSDPIPRYRIGDHSLPADAAYQLIHDEMTLDGTPLLNLASFVTSWMEPQADKLFAEVANKNFIDQEEYPVTTVLERRCVNIIAELFNAPADGDQAVGTSTIGSSEAIHLCGLALKRNWVARRAAAGKPSDKPNLVMSTAVHVTWEKFCRYFDVECRQAPLAEGRYVIDPDAALALCDENTIGVVGILGTTYTGHFEPIEALDKAVTKWNKANDGHLAVHVDAASGGFVAPFAYPHLKWDFRLSNVRSINVSGHKYGLVYPGVGWAIWRDAADLPEELIFHDSYLGNDQSTFDLNFSKPAAGIVGQYYNLIRLGREGYTSVMRNALDTWEYLTETIESRGHVELLSEPGHLPVVCGRMKVEIDEADPPFNAHDVSAHLRRRGWIVPAYTMPADVEEMTVVRTVIREGFSRDMADKLVDDFHDTAAELLADPPVAPKPHRRSKNRVC
jgi:glutamate decarboxylase